MKLTPVRSITRLRAPPASTPPSTWSSPPTFENVTSPSIATTVVPGASGSVV